jgi:site-specific DNA recombinase
MEIAGAYIRKSNVSKVADGLKSVEQQLDAVRAFVAARGWKLDERYVYTDDEISGEEWVKRPGYQALRAKLTKPPFKHMIVWERSRLGRDAIRQLMFINEMTESGIDVWAVNENKKLLANEIGTMVGAYMDEKNNDDTRDRVNRALDGRFDRGFVTGGSVYGYRIAREDGAVERAARRVIHEPEAVIVRRIFALRAEGYGQTKIAKLLASEGVPSPKRITEGGRVRRELKNEQRIEAGLEPLKPISEKWSGDGVREILLRTLYKGDVVRGAKKRGKRGGTKIRVATPDRVQVRHNELVRIVSEDLWNAAHAKMDEASAQFLRVHSRIVGRPENFQGRHLLSSIAKCAVCGAPLHAVARGTNMRLSYICSANRTSGASACVNA